MKTKYTLLLLLFISFTVSIFGQNKKLDSILSEINTVAIPEKRQEKLDSIIKNYLRGNDLDLYEHFIDIVITESKEKNQTKRLNEMYLEKAFSLRQRSLLDSSFFYIEKVLKTSEILEDEMLKLRATSAKAQVFESKGQYPDAIAQYLEAISYYDSNGLEENREKLIDMFNLASVYLFTGEIDKSLAAHKPLYENPVIRAEPEFLNEVIVNYAGALLYADKLEEAEKLLLEAETTETRVAYRAQIALLLSAIYQQNGSYKKSLKYQEISEKLFLESGDRLRYETLRINRGKLLIDLKRYNEAEQVYKDSELFILNNKEIHPELPRALYEGMSELYRNMQRYKDALVYTDRKNDLKDSILSIEKQKAISELEIKFETEKKEQEKQEALNQVQIAQLESTKNRTLFIAAVVVALILLIAGLLYASRLRAKKKAELITLELKETQKRLALEKQYRDSELKALKAQMNPHFIFNALNSIQEYIILNEKNLAGDYLGKFADLMRRYLQYSDAGHITLQQEVESLNMYLDLEALRFGEDLQYKVTIDGDLNPELIKIPTMLIQPYAENALKHGLLHKQKDKHLDIAFTQSNPKTVTCFITDNGIGREASTKIKAQVDNLQPSFSSQANETRLDLLNKREDVHVGVQINDLIDAQGNATGTQVILNIPILKN